MTLDNDSLGPPVASELPTIRTITAESDGPETMRHFQPDWRLYTGVLIIAAIVVVAIVEPLLPLPDPVKTDLAHRLEAPSAAHPFGTDGYGRDVLARVLGGARYALLVAAVSGGLVLVLGTTLGIAAGYYGGVRGHSATIVVDSLLALPALVLALLVVATFGPSTLNASLAIGIAFSPRLARILRARVITMRREPYIEAARVANLGSLAIIRRHVIPNTLSTILSVTAVMTAGALLAEAGLSFLGLGTQPPAPSWGLMVSEGRQALRIAPWDSLAGGGAIFLLVLGINLAADALLDVFDPSAKALR